MLMFDKVNATLLEIIRVLIQEAVSCRTDPLVKKKLLLSTFNLSFMLVVE